MKAQKKIRLSMYSGAELLLMNVLRGKKVANEINQELDRRSDLAFDSKSYRSLVDAIHKC